MSASVADVPAIRAAYQHCEQVTRTQARNFSYGIRLLPPDKRRALSAVYALARRIDDIGDGTLPAQDKLTALGQVRVQLDLLASGGRPASDGTPVSDGPPASDGRLAGPGGSGDPVLIAIADAGSRYPIPLSAFGELIDGCEADVRGTVYGTFSDLEHYCRCVAGSIGRLSLEHLRQPRPRRRRAAGRRARRGAAADQYPQGHPGGFRYRPGVPAGRRSRSLRLLDDAGRPGRAAGRRGAGATGPLRGAAGPALV